jgi:hypothetical protein
MPKTTPSYATRRQPLLDALLKAFPAALRPDEVETHGGKNCTARIEELRRAGWKIEADIDAATHRAAYRLTSKVPDAPAVIHAGLTLRFDSREGWTTRTHQEAIKSGHIPAEVLLKAQAAAQAAYVSVVGPYLPSADEDGLNAFLALSGGAR